MEKEENMSVGMVKYALIIAVAIVLVMDGRVHARHVTHRVTPANLDKQLFSFTVDVKDAGQAKEFKITVKQTILHPGLLGSATGTVVIDPCGQKKAAFPAVTRTQAEGVQTYTFRVPVSDLDRAHFTFTETPQNSRTPFPFPGDYWVFDLKDFVPKAKKSDKISVPIRFTPPKR
jgi:hypothetical protein